MHNQFYTHTHTHTHAHIHKHTLTYTVTITCGNFKLTDIELVQRSADTATVNDATESLTTLYHCAEGVTTDNSVSSICFSDGVSRWNTDLANQGCTSSGASTDSAGKCHN